MQQVYISAHTTCAGIYEQFIFLNKIKVKTFYSCGFWQHTNICARTAAQRRSYSEQCVRSCSSILPVAGNNQLPDSRTIVRGLTSYDAQPLTNYRSTSYSYTHQLFLISVFQHYPYSHLFYPNSNHICCCHGWLVQVYSSQCSSQRSYRS